MLKKRTKFLKDFLPIFSESSGATTLKNGKKIHYFEYEPVDYEQMTSSSQGQIPANLGNMIRNLSADNWVSFYSWNRYYACSSSTEIEIPHSSRREIDGGTSFFLGDSLKSDINFYENYMTVGLEFWRFVSITTPFSETCFDFMDKFDVDYVVSIQKLSDESSKQKLSHIRRAQANSIRTSTHQNHEGESAYRQANELLSDIHREDEKLVNVNLTLVIKDSNLESLNNKTQELFKKELSSTRSFIETDAIPYIFRSLVLGVSPRFENSFITTLSYSVNLIPFKKSYLHDKGLVLWDKRNWDKIYFDFLNKDLINNHMLVTGASGAGKSFFIGSLLLELRERNQSVAVFDFGNSFGRIVKYLNGQNLEKRINPMQFKTDITFLKNFIASFLDSRNMNRLEHGKLYRAVEKATEKNPKTFQELVFLMEYDYPDLTLYFCEMWDYFTDEIVEIPEFFFVDTKGISEYLIAPYLVFAKKLIDTSKRDYVSVYDESYVFFEKCPDIIRTSVKSERKEGHKNIYITQEVVELQRDYSKVADSIIGNTETKIFFQQKDANHPSINQETRDKITQLQSVKNKYSEFLIVNSNTCKVARLFASSLVYSLCHTEAKTRLEQDKFLNQLEPLIGFQEAMNRWVEVYHG